MSHTVYAADDIADFSCVDRVLRRMCPHSVHESPHRNVGLQPFNSSSASSLLGPYAGTSHVEDTSDSSLDFHLSTTESPDPGVPAQLRNGKQTESLTAPYPLERKEVRVETNNMEPSHPDAPQHERPHTPPRSVYFFPHPHHPHHPQHQHLQREKSPMLPFCISVKLSLDLIRGEESYSYVGI
ncbi:unnamed protein product [Pleuronectes platessa]|uniref:Uncharacterized protein n=1 Tax=Pleuronectes platessa TaxID=8262 RepID=A0A9N7YQ37_PLEPL|nr:unnamed protein product [Pleuronectes platessa]